MVRPTGFHGRHCPEGRDRPPSSVPQTEGQAYAEDEDQASSLHLQVVRSPRVLGFHRERTTRRAPHALVGRGPRGRVVLEVRQGRRHEAKGACPTLSSSDKVWRAHPSPFTGGPATIPFGWLARWGRYHVSSSRRECEFDSHLGCRGRQVGYLPSSWGISNVLLGRPLVWEFPHLQALVLR